MCLIGYHLTDADIKKLQSYLESIEPDRYPLIPGKKYIFLLLYTVIVVSSLLCYYALIYHLLAMVFVSILVVSVTISISVEILYNR